MISLYCCDTHENSSSQQLKDGLMLDQIIYISIPVIVHNIKKLEKKCLKEIVQIIYETICYT